MAENTEIKVKNAIPSLNRNMAQPRFGPNRGGGPNRFAKPPKLKNPKGTVMCMLSYTKGKMGRMTLVFFMALFTTLVTIIGTRLNGYVVDNFITTGDYRGLVIICLIMIGMYIVSVVANYGQQYLMLVVAQRMAAEIRRDLFAKVQHLPLKYYDSHSSGDLMSRLTNDVDNINTALAQNAVQLFSSSVQVIGVFIAMLLLSPMLCLIALVTTPLSRLVSRLIIKVAQK
jgi:ATP-binding cassette subfamily B protein